jgi:hypothetical protein
LWGIPSKLLVKCPTALLNKGKRLLRRSASLS